MVVEVIRTRPEAGQTMAEYSVVLGVITFTIVTTISLISGGVLRAFERTLQIIQTIL